MVKYTKILTAVVGLLLMAGNLCAQESDDYLGIIINNVNESIAAQQGLKNLRGVLVVDIFKESPAEKNGLLKNDIILKLDGRDINDTAQLLEKIGQYTNKTVKVEGIRSSASFSLLVTIGEKTDKTSYLTVTAFNEESAGDQAEKDGNSRQAVDHYVNALDEQYRTAEEIPGDADFRLRQKIITIVQRLKVPPATPEQAERAMAVARAAQAVAIDEAGYKKAIQKYAEASRSAPWLADLYFNLGVLCERNGDLYDSIHSYKLYLLAEPDAEVSQTVKDKIYLLEDKLKEKEAAEEAAYKAWKAAIDRIPEERWGLSLSAGMNSLKSDTFHWSGDSFSRVYKGITWEPGLHLGIEGSFNIYSNPKRNSFMSSATLGIFFENNTSSPSSVMLTNTDLVTHRTTTASRNLTEKSFSMSKIIISDKLTFGYRVMLNPDFTFEPYGGIGVQIELISLSGTEVNDKDFDSDGDFGFGFPFGARILIHHFFMGFEYNSIVKLWGGELDYYEDPTKANSKREKGVLSRESASYWAIHIGTIF